MLSWHPATSHPRARSALRGAAPLAALLCATLIVLSACASSGSTTTNTGNNGTPSATATTAPTATTKPKPTSVPAVTVAYCQGLVSLADANNFMKPAAPATAITALNVAPVASCNYASASAPSRYVLVVIFLPFPQGTSVSAITQQLLTRAAQAEAHWSITTTPVSGIGDQAMYVSATASLNGFTGYWVGLATTVGQIAIGCETYGIGSAPPLQPALTQVCTQVVSRL
jgi:hypothetical protein